MAELPIEQSEIWPNVPICAPEYYAGIVDGEGSIGIYGKFSKRSQKRYWQTCCTVGMSSSIITASFAARFGGGVLRRKDVFGKKPMWIWSIGKRSEVLSFLSVVTPFLIEKRAQALMVIKYLKDIEAHGSRSVNHLAYELDVKEMKVA